jgi:hypothetical protein
MSANLSALACAIHRRSTFLLVERLQLNFRLADINHAHDARSAHMNPNGVAVKQIQIAEPRGLAAVSLPDPWYPLRDTLDPFQIIATGKLSSLQVRAFVCTTTRQGHCTHDFVRNSTAANRCDLSLLTNGLVSSHNGEVKSLPASLTFCNPLACGLRPLYSRLCTARGRTLCVSAPPTDACWWYSSWLLSGYAYVSIFVPVCTRGREGWRVRGRGEWRRSSAHGIEDSVCV